MEVNEGRRNSVNIDAITKSVAWELCHLKHDPCETSMKVQDSLGQSRNTKQMRHHLTPESI